MRVFIRRFIKRPARKAGAIYTADDVDTALCVWEYLLECLAIPAKYTNPSAAGIHKCRETIGAANLRLEILNWLPTIREDWVRTDTRDGQFPQGGQYDRGSFDWNFIPDWVRLNIDWSDPNKPKLRTFEEK